MVKVQPHDRAKRWSMTDAREQMLAHGVKLLLTEGIQLGMSHITLDRVIKDVGVPRATAYRAWSGPGIRHPQQSFQLEVLLRTINPEPGVHRVEATTAVAHDLFGSTDDRSRAALSALARLSAMETIRARRHDPTWNIHLILGSMLSGPSGDLTRRARRELQHADRLSSARYEEFYGLIAGAFGLRLREGRTLYQFAQVTGALADGLLLRETYQAPDEPFDAAHAFGEMFDLSIDAYFEPAEQNP